jgi:phage-related protein
VTYPNGYTLDLDFTLGSIPGGMTFARASTATDGLWTDAAGSSYNSFSSGQARLSSSGLMFEGQARTNYLLNSASPANQTTPSILNTWGMCLWMIGTGSVTVTAGTGAATGLGTATAGNPVFFTVTSAGTFNIAVSGSVNRFQLERGGCPSSFIPTAGASVTRAAESCTLATGAWYSAGQGTLASAGALTAVTNQAGCGFGSLDDGTTSNFIRHTLSSNPLGQAQVTAGGVSQMAVNPDATTLVRGVTDRLAIYWTSGGNIRAAAQGTLATLNTGKTIPTLNRLALMTGSTATLGITAFVSHITYWPFALSDADLQSATTNPPRAQVSATGRGSAAAGIAAPSNLPVRPLARGTAIASGQSVRTIYTAAGRAMPFSSAVPIGSAGEPATVLSVPTLGRAIARARAVANLIGSAQGRGSLLPRGGAGAAVRSSVQAIGAAKPRGRALPIIPQPVAARGKAVARGRTAGTAASTFGARGTAVARALLAPPGNQLFGRGFAAAFGLADHHPVVSVGALGLASLPWGGAGLGPGPLIITPPTVWQRLAVMTPQHQLSEKPRIIANQFGDGYQQTIPDGLTPIARTLTLTWPTLEAWAVDELVQFLRDRVGVAFSFRAPGDAAPRNWLATSWQRSSPQPNSDGLTVQFEERLYVERTLLLSITGRDIIGTGTLA